MSHFSVLVIGENPEEQLKPFQENNMGNCPGEYLTFEEKETEYLENYNTKTSTKVILPDGSRLSPYDERFRVAKTFGMGTETHKVPDALEQREIPLKELYPDFDTFMKDYAGFNEKDPVMGKYGYWSNPNSKWDWYQLGGRMRGFFKLKHPNTAVVLGEAGVGDNKPRFDCDQARKKDIDFAGMMDVTGEEAKKRYEMLERLLGGSIPQLDFPWGVIIDENNTQFKDMPIEAKRNFYHAQPAMRKVVEAREKMVRPKDREPREEYDLITWMDLEDYQISKEEYILNARNASGLTFAIVKDGKFFERGSMGWWGIVSNEKDRKEWNNRFHTLLNDLPEDTLLSVFDCHI